MENQDLQKAPSNEDNISQEEGSGQQPAGNVELIPPFLPDQRVFCFDLTKKAGQINPNSSDSGNRRYYEATVRQVRHNPLEADPSARWSCLVHYQGWNARWDHWVSPAYLVPDTPEHRKRYEEQQKEAEIKRQTEVEAQKQKQQRKQQKKRDQATATAGKSGVGRVVAPENASCTLPFTLKTIMVDEWENITRKGYAAPYGIENDLTLVESNNTSAGNNGNSDTPPSKKVKSTRPARSVHCLPSAVTVRQFLKHFEKKERKKWQQKLEEQKQKASSSETPENGRKDNDNKEQPTNTTTEKSKNIPLDPKKEVKQFCRGLGRLFEEALPVCLLYSEERPQYQHYIKDTDNFAIDVYGCEFLLRLLVRLPFLMKRPLEYPFFLVDLTVMLQQNRVACFKGKFRPPEYPHEWLDWEKGFYGDPRLHEVEETTKGKVKQEEDANSSGSEDLFS